MFLVLQLLRLPQSWLFPQLRLRRLQLLRQPTAALLLCRRVVRARALFTSPTTMVLSLSVHRLCILMQILLMSTAVH